MPIHHIHPKSKRWSSTTTLITTTLLMHILSAITNVTSFVISSYSFHKLSSCCPSSSLSINQRCNKAPVYHQPNRQHNHPNHRNQIIRPNMSSASTPPPPPTTTTTTALETSLKKSRGTSVSVQYHPPSSSAPLSSIELEMISQQLRKVGVASVWTSDLDALPILTKEQESARGNFPGPCPIIYDARCREDDVEAMKQAVSCGSTAIVLNTSASSCPEWTDEDALSSIDDADLIWSVDSVENVQTVLGLRHHSFAFLLSGRVDDLSHDSDKDNETQLQLKEILRAIPQNALVIASVPAMQPNGAEIVLGKQLASLTPSLPREDENGDDGGSASIRALLVERACVGDAEDVKYASYVVDNMTKKASSTFKMTGLTGSTNGHFGTASDSFEGAKWRRTSQ